MASWGYRVGGHLIDIAAAIVPAWAVSATLQYAGVESDVAVTVWFVTAVVIWMLNTTVLFGATGGRSLGKLVGGMSVIREDGRRAGYGLGLLRNTICRLIYVIPFVWLADNLWPLGDDRQALRDKMVSTRVMREPSYPRRAWPLAITAVCVLALIYGAAVLASDAEERNSGYTASDREAFIEGCTEDDSSRGDCACLYRYIADRVAYDDYREADQNTNIDRWPANVRDTAEAGSAICFTDDTPTLPEPQETSVTFDGKQYSCSNVVLGQIDDAKRAVITARKPLADMRYALEQIDRKYPSNTLPPATYERYETLRKRYNWRVDHSNRAIDRYNQKLESLCDRS